MGDSAAFFAAGHYGGVEALAEAGRQVVNFMRPIDFNGLAGGAEGDFAVAAPVQMLVQLGASLHSHFIVNEVVEEGEKLCAGHFSAPFLRRK
jgi:hypothetical protein